MKGVLLHHWDTDGLCSCAILRNELKKDKRDMEWTYFIPQIGNYFLTENEMKGFEEAGLDELTIADMAIPSDQIKRLSGSIGHITHYDHHFQPLHNMPNVTHINPVAAGKEAAEAPANTIVLMDQFHRRFDLQTALGVVGDLEHKVFDNARAGPLVSSYANAHGLCYMDLIRMCDLVNANFKTDDIDAVHRATDLLTEIGDDPGPILFNGDWQRKLEKISAQVDEWLKAPVEDRGQLLLLKMDSSCHIISTVGRHLFRRYDRQVLLTNTGLKNIDQIYVRGFDMRKAINYARSKGLRAGGKKDAFGAILEKGGLDDFLPGLIEVLISEEGK
jgi:hypothetical protein